MKSILSLGAFSFLFAMALNFIMWWAGLSLVSSVIKSFGDCNQKYNIERFKVQTDWFCPTEEYTISQMMPKENNRRR